MPFWGPQQGILVEHPEKELWNSKRTRHTRSHARKPSGLGESPGEGEDGGEGRHASFLERSVVISPSPGRLGTHTLHLRLSVLRGDCQLWCEGGHGAGWNGSLQNSSVPGGGRFQAFLSTSTWGVILTKSRECSFSVKGKVWWIVSQVKRVDNCCIIRQHNPTQRLRMRCSPSFLPARQWRRRQLISPLSPSLLCFSHFFSFSRFICKADQKPS